MDAWEYYSSRKGMVDEAVSRFLEERGLSDVSPTPLGGKRLRGVLTLLVAESLGARPEDALDLAVAVELAHAASLDADDIVDLDVFRRGNPATWVLKGIVRAAVGTHGLVAAALDIVRRRGMEAVEVFADTYMAMVKGEVKDVLSGGVYEAIISAKTASLWGAAAAYGALAAGRKDLVGEAREYGHAVGMAFQIADDIVDTAKIIERMELWKLAQPSVMAFIVYLGLEALAKAPLKLLMTGVRGVRSEVEKAAMEKLEEWIRKAQGHAEKLPAEEEYKKLLAEYPRLSARLMMREMGQGGGPT